MACSDHFAVLRLLFIHTLEFPALFTVCRATIQRSPLPRRHGCDGPLVMQLHRPMPYTAKACENALPEVPVIHTLNSMNESEDPPPLAFGTGTRNCKLSNPSASIRKEVFVEL